VKWLQALYERLFYIFDQFQNHWNYQCYIELMFDARNVIKCSRIFFIDSSKCHFKRFLLEFRIWTRFESLRKYIFISSKIIKRSSKYVVRIPENWFSAWHQGSRIFARPWWTNKYFPIVSCSIWMIQEFSKFVQKANYYLHQHTLNI